MHAVAPRIPRRSPGRESALGGRELDGVVERAQAGDQRAFEVLVAEFGPRLHRFLAVQVWDDGDARDALQETLLAAWQELPRLRDRTKLWPWLAGIAAHKAGDAVRRKAPAPRGDRLDRSEAADSGVVELKEAIAGLPARLREVVLLRYLLQLSEQEVARALGIRVGTVKSRAARARERLARELG